MQQLIQIPFRINNIHQSFIGPIQTEFQNKGEPLLISVEDLGSAIDNEMSNNMGQFPFGIFPYPIQQLINNAYETVGYNKEFFSAGILSVVATAIGNSASLHNGSYHSKPIFWITIIGSRGTRKTHPLSFAKKPIEDHDSKTFEEYKKDFEEYELKDRKGEKPHYSKFILKDFTPEKLADTLQHNEKGILIFQDELMRWVNSFDQYKKGGDQQMYLDLFNGGNLTVDRVTKAPIRIEEANVNILGGMQPEVIKGLAKNNRGEDGFLDRFLFCYPEITEPQEFTGLEIDAHHKNNYETLIYNLLDLHSLMLRTNNSTIEIYKKWQHEKVKEYFNDQLEAAIQAKLETYVWRFALLIELMYRAEMPCESLIIRNESVTNAIKLVEYFRYSALKVHDKILSKNPLEDLTAMQKDLFLELPFNFKRSDVLPLFKARKFSIRSADRFLRNNKLFDNYQSCKVLKVGNYKKKF